MTISEIQFIPIKPKEGCFGFASFLLDNSLYIGSVAIYSRPGGGVRLVWPQINNRGKKFAAVHPITRELSQSIEEAVGKEVLEAFSEL